MEGKINVRKKTVREISIYVIYFIASSLVMILSRNFTQIPFLALISLEYLSVAALSLLLDYGLYFPLILSAIGAACTGLLAPAGPYPGYYHSTGIIIEGFIFFYYRYRSPGRDKSSKVPGNPAAREQEVFMENLGKNLSEINEMLDAYSGKVDGLFFSSLELNSRVNNTVEEWRHLMDSINWTDSEIDKEDDLVDLNVTRQEEFCLKLEDLTVHVHKASEINKILKDNAEMGKSGLSTVSESNKKFLKYQKHMMDINKLIQDISNRTHILSLNASIEATKAGTYGHGFSIVAGEIRRLADESRRQSGEINNLIKGMNKEIDSSIRIMDNVNQNFMMILGGIDESYPIIEGIGESMTKIMEGGKLTQENIKSLKHGMALIKENNDKEGKIAEEYYNTFISLRDYFNMLANTIDELKDYNQKSSVSLKNIGSLQRPGKANDPAEGF